MGDHLQDDLDWYADGDHEMHTDPPLLCNGVPGQHLRMKVVSDFYSRRHKGRPQIEKNGKKTDIV